MLKNYKVVLLLFVIVTVSFSEKYQISGVVHDQHGKTIDGLITTLVNQNKKDTTDIYGKYEFSDNTSKNIFLNKADVFYEKPMLKNNAIFFSLTTPTLFNIDVYTISGKKLYQLSQQYTTRGTFNFSLLKISRNIAEGVYLVRVSVNNKVSVFRWIVSGRLLNSSKSHLKVSTLPVAKKRAILIDTVKIYADTKMINKRVISYDTSLTLLSPDSVFDIVIKIGCIATVPVNNMLLIFKPNTSKWSSTDSIFYPDTIKIPYITLGDTVSCQSYFNMSDSTLSASVITTDALGRLIGRSENITIMNSDDTVTIPFFNGEGAIPSVYAGNDDTVSLYDTIKLAGITSDSIRSISSAYWSIDGAPFVSVSDNDTQFVAPGSPDIIKCIFKATDNDNITIADTITVSVIEDKPTAVLVIADSVLFDSSYIINFSSSTPGKFGSIKSYKLKIGTNDFLSVTLSDTDFTAPSDIMDSMPIILQVTDDDGNIDYDTAKINIYHWWDYGDLTKWSWRDAIIYNLVTDRFMDGDPTNNSVIGGVESKVNYKGGDIAGIKSKLESGYFSDLGVNVLGISSPVENRNFPGTNADGHDYSAFLGFWNSPEVITFPPTSPLPMHETYFGDSAILKSLVDKIHQDNMRIIMNHEINHVDSSSQLYQSKKNDWFISGTPLLGIDIPWDGDSACYGSFEKFLPAFNYDVQDARNWSYENALWWSEKFDYDAIMLDPVKFVLPIWLTEFKNRAKSDLKLQDEFSIFGSVFTFTEDEMQPFIDKDTKASGLNSFVFAKNSADALLSGTSTCSALAAWLETVQPRYSNGELIINSLENISTKRAIHYANGDFTFTDNVDGWTTQMQPSTASSYEKLLLAYVFMMTTPGLPSIFYGGEIAMAGGSSPDNCAMMIFDGGSLSANQTLFFDDFKKLPIIRSSNKALTRGIYKTLDSGSDYIVYQMGGLQNLAPDIITAINRSDSQRTITIPTGTYTDLISLETITGSSVSVAARNYRILRKN